jgi:hypothetical protein
MVEKWDVDYQWVVLVLKKMSTTFYVGLSFSTMRYLNHINNNRNLT